MSWAIVLAIVSIGCNQGTEAITRYRVPKLPASRLLGVIVPHGGKTWFVKLSGPAPAIDEAVTAYTQFVNSLHFSDDPAKPLKWTVPEDWKEEPGSEMRFATLRFQVQNTPLEVSITSFPGQAGSVLANVNRWRKQIGLEEIEEQGLSEVIKEGKIDGIPCTLVDMTGSGGGDAMMPPAAHAPSKPARPAERSPVEYQAPPNWHEEPDPKGIRPIYFRVGSGESAAEAAIMMAGGDTLANVNRWRGQVGLTPIDAQGLQKEGRAVTIDGRPSLAFDLAGPEGNRRQRLLAAIVPAGDGSWFVTLRGPYAVVTDNRDSFDVFLKSIRFADK